MSTPEAPRPPSSGGGWVPWFFAAPIAFAAALGVVVLVLLILEKATGP